MALSAVRQIKGGTIMKNEYKAPVIEKLIWQDILLASNEIDPNKNDDVNVGGDLLSFIWDGGE